MKSWRPTDKELKKKLEAARAAVAKGSYYFAVPEKVYADLEELDLFTKEDLKNGLSAALSEICSKDYKGSRPPQKAYEVEIKDKELFAFCFESTFFKCRIYLKFVELGNNKGPGLAIVSFHKDRLLA